MGIYLRLLASLLRTWFKQDKHALTDKSVITMRAWLNDIDVSNVTNDRYHAYLDLGRLVLAARLDPLAHLLGKGWTPLLKSVCIRHRRSIRVLQTFELHTQIVSWDADWFWVKQEVISQGQVAAIAYSQMKLGKKGAAALKPQQILLLCGMNPHASPPMVVPTMALMEAA